MEWSGAVVPLNPHRIDDLGLEISCFIASKQQVIEWGAFAVDDDSWQALLVENPRGFGIAKRLEQMAGAKVVEGVELDGMETFQCCGTQVFSWFLF